MMNPKHEKLYLVILFQQLNWAMIAYKSLLEAARIYEIDDVMMEAHAMLVHAMGGSRILWPKTGDKTRGAHLRQVLGVSDDHPLRNSARRARNFLEHFDERLDSFVRSAQGERTVLQGLNAGSSHTGGEHITVREHDVEDGGTPHPERLLRDFDTRSKRLILADESIDLGDLSEQVLEIGTLVNRVLVDRFVAMGGPQQNVGPGFPDLSVTIRFSKGAEA